MEMKYNENNKPLECIMKNSTCYKNAGNGIPVGILLHDTAAGNSYVKRYVQPHKNDSNYSELIKKIGKNKYENDWNHVYQEKGVNAFIGKMSDDSVSAVQALPWHHRPWGCGSGNKGSCNGVDGGNFWIQIECCDDNYVSKEYFDKVYKEVCELIAFLCVKYNINPNGTVKYNGVTVPTILCHADSSKLGLGSNHEDVLKWFGKFGKTMGNVREDVRYLMEKEENTVKPPVNVVNTIKRGDIVKINDNATYYSGKTIPNWVREKTWVVEKVTGDRVVIDESSDGKNAICSPINAKFLTVVLKSNNDVDSGVNNFAPYLIKVTADVLRIRKNPGTNYDIVGKIKKVDNDVYTIIDEANGQGASKWGLLKSYKDNRDGWISLDYIKRV